MATNYTIDLSKLKWDGTSFSSVEAAHPVTLGSAQYTLDVAGQEITLVSTADTNVTLGTLKADGTTVKSLAFAEADGLHGAPQEFAFTGYDKVTSVATGDTTVTAADSLDSFTGLATNASVDGAFAYWTDTAQTTHNANGLRHNADNTLVDISSANDATVTLKAGTKETITIGAGTATVNSYVYGEDKLIEATGSTVTGVDNTGKLTGAGTGVQVQMTGNTYRAKVYSSDGKAREYWTAAAGASSVEMDANKNDADTPVTFDLRGAATAKVVSGRGNDAITGDENVALTYEISRERGNDTITGMTFGTDDLIIFDNAQDLGKDQITVQGTTLRYGGKDQTTTLTGALDPNGGQTYFSFDGGKTKEKIGYGKKIAYDKDNTIYIGDSANTTSANTITGATAGIDLSDEKKFREITYVEVDGKAAAGSQFIGKNNTSTTVDATNATDSIYWYGNLGENAGTGAKAVVTLGAADKAQDTIKFGKGEGKGTADVSGFAGGFDKTDDVLYFYDADSVKDVKLGEKVNTNGQLVFGAGNASLNVTLATGTETGDALFMQFKDGVTKKVALETAAKADAKTVGDTIKADGADIVYGNEASKGKNWVVYTADTKEESGLNLTTETDKFINITNVDASASTVQFGYAGNVNSTDAMTIKTGKGQTLIWDAQTTSDTIELNNDKGKLADVWYAGKNANGWAGDGKDTVTGVTADTRVMFYGVESLKKLRDDYTTSYDGTKLTFTDVNATDKNILTLVNRDSYTDQNITVLLDGGDLGNYANYTAVKANYADATHANTFSSDTNLYLGDSATVEAGIKVEGEYSIFLSQGDDDGPNNETGKYYFDKNVNTFDASKSEAAFTLVGRGLGTNSTLMGGLSRNLYWGGGASQDTFVGQEDAIDMVMFGMKDDHDTFRNYGTGDSVFLYDIDDITKVSVNEAGDVISVNDGLSTLTLTNPTGQAVDASSLTFYTSDHTGYKYDKSAKKFTATGTSF